MYVLNLAPFASILSYIYKNMCGSGSVFGIRIRIHKVPEYGSNTDPDSDPQHCFKGYMLKLIWWPLLAISQLISILLLLFYIIFTLYIFSRPAKYRGVVKYGYIYHKDSYPPPRPPPPGPPTPSPPPIAPPAPLPLLV